MIVIFNESFLEDIRRIDNTVVLDQYSLNGYSIKTTKLSDLFTETGAPLIKEKISGCVYTPEDKILKIHIELNDEITKYSILRLYSNNTVVMVIVNEITRNTDNELEITPFSLCQTNNLFTIQLPETTIATITCPKEKTVDFLEKYGIDLGGNVFNVNSIGSGIITTTESYIKCKAILNTTKYVSNVDNEFTCYTDYETVNRFPLYTRTGENIKNNTVNSVGQIIKPEYKYRVYSNLYIYCSGTDNITNLPTKFGVRDYIEPGNTDPKKLGNKIKIYGTADYIEISYFNGVYKIVDKGQCSIDTIPGLWFERVDKNGGLGCKIDNDTQSIEVIPSNSYKLDSNAIYVAHIKCISERNTEYSIVSNKLRLIYGEKEDIWKVETDTSYYEDTNNYDKVPVFLFDHTKNSSNSHEFTIITTFNITNKNDIKIDLEDELLKTFFDYKYSISTLYEDDKKTVKGTKIFVKLSTLQSNKDTVKWNPIDKNGNSVLKYLSVSYEGFTSYFYMVQKPNIKSLNLYEFNEIGGVLRKVNKVVFEANETDKTYYMIADEKISPTIRPWWIYPGSTTLDDLGISVSCDYYKNGKYSNPIHYDRKGRFSVYPKACMNMVVSSTSTKDYEDLNIVVINNSYSINKDGIIQVNDRVKTTSGDQYNYDVSNNITTSTTSDDQDVLIINEASTTTVESNTGTTTTYSPDIESTSANSTNKYNGGSRRAARTTTSSGTVDSNGNVTTSTEISVADNLEYVDCEGMQQVLTDLDKQGLRVFVDKNSKVITDARYIYNQLHPVFIHFEKAPDSVRPITCDDEKLKFYRVGYEDTINDSTIDAFRELDWRETVRQATLELPISKNGQEPRIDFAKEYISMTSDDINRKTSPRTVTRSIINLDVYQISKYSFIVKSNCPIDLKINYTSGHSNSIIFDDTNNTDFTVTNKSLRGNPDEDNFDNEFGKEIYLQLRKADKIGQIAEIIAQYSGYKRILPIVAQSFSDYKTINYATDDGELIIKGQETVDDKCVFLKNNTATKKFNCRRTPDIKKIKNTDISINDNPTFNSGTGDDSYESSSLILESTDETTTYFPSPIKESLTIYPYDESGDYNNSEYINYYIFKYGIKPDIEVVKYPEILSNTEYQNTIVTKHLDKYNKNENWDINIGDNHIMQAFINSSGEVRYALEDQFITDPEGISLRDEECSKFFTRIDVKAAWKCTDNISDELCTTSYKPSVGDYPYHIIDANYHVPLGTSIIPKCIRWGKKITEVNYTDDVPYFKIGDKKYKYKEDISSKNVFYYSDDINEYLHDESYNYTSAIVETNYRLQYNIWDEVNDKLKLSPSRLVKNTNITNSCIFELEEVDPEKEVWEYDATSKTYIIKNPLSIEPSDDLQSFFVIDDPLDVSTTLKHYSGVLSVNFSNNSLLYITGFTTDHDFNQDILIRNTEYFTNTKTIKLSFDYIYDDDLQSGKITNIKVERSYENKEAALNIYSSELDLCKDIDIQVDNTSDKLFTITDIREELPTLSGSRFRYFITIKGTSEPISESTSLGNLKLVPKARKIAWKDKISEDIPDSVFNDIPYVVSNFDEDFDNLKISPTSFNTKSPYYKRYDEDWIELYDTSLDGKNYETRDDYEDWRSSLSKAQEKVDKFIRPVSPILLNIKQATDNSIEILGDKITNFDPYGEKRIFLVKNYNPRYTSKNLRVRSSNLFTYENILKANKIKYINGYYSFIKNNLFSGDTYIKWEITTKISSLTVTYQFLNGYKLDYAKLSIKLYKYDENNELIEVYGDDIKSEDGEEKTLYIETFNDDEIIEHGLLEIKWDTTNINKEELNCVLNILGTSRDIYYKSDLVTVNNDNNIPSTNKKSLPNFEINIPSILENTNIGYNPSEASTYSKFRQVEYSFPISVDYGTWRDSGTWSPDGEPSYSEILTITRDKLENGLIIGVGDNNYNKQKPKIYFGNQNSIEISVDYNIKNYDILAGIFKLPEQGPIKNGTIGDGKVISIQSPEGCTYEIISNTCIYTNDTNFIRNFRLCFPENTKDKIIYRDFIVYYKNSDNKQMHSITLRIKQGCNLGIVKSELISGVKFLSNGKCFGSPIINSKCLKLNTHDVTKEFKTIELFRGDFKDDIIKSDASSTETGTEISYINWVSKDIENPLTLYTISEVKTIISETRLFEYVGTEIKLSDKYFIDSYEWINIVGDGNFYIDTNILRSELCLKINSDNEGEILALLGTGSNTTTIEGFTRYPVYITLPPNTTNSIKNWTLTISRYYQEYDQDTDTVKTKYIDIEKIPLEQGYYSLQLFNPLYSSNTSSEPEYVTSNGLLGTAKNLIQLDPDYTYPQPSPEMKLKLVRKEPGYDSWVDYGEELIKNYCIDEKGKLQNINLDSFNWSILNTTGEKIIVNNSTYIKTVEEDEIIDGTISVYDFKQLKDRFYSKYIVGYITEIRNKDNGVFKISDDTVGCDSDSLIWVYGIDNPDILILGKKIVIKGIYSTSAPSANNYFKPKDDIELPLGYKTIITKEDSSNEILVDNNYKVADGFKKQDINIYLSMAINVNYPKDDLLLPGESNIFRFGAYLNRKRNTDTN